MKNIRSIKVTRSNSFFICDSDLELKSFFEGNFMRNAKKVIVLKDLIDVSGKIELTF